MGNQHDPEPSVLDSDAAAERPRPRLGPNSGPWIPPEQRPRHREAWRPPVADQAGPRLQLENASPDGAEEQSFQWPESYAPPAGYVADGIEVVEPLGARVKRLALRVSDVALHTSRDYVERLATSRTVRMMSLALILLPIGFAVRSHLQNRPATLEIVCYHPFHAAQLTVWVDGKPVLDDVITGAATFERHNWRPYWQREPATYVAQPFTLLHAPHQVRVRIASTEDPYDQSATVGFELPPASSNALQVSCGHGALALALLDHAVSAGH